MTEHAFNPSTLEFQTVLFIGIPGSQPELLRNTLGDVLGRGGVGSHCIVQVCLELNYVPRLVLNSILLPPHVVPAQCKTLDA